MHVILRTQFLSQAYSLRTALEAAGIEAAINGEFSLGTIGGGVSVVVLRDEDVPAANAVLAGLSGPSPRDA